MAHDWIEREVVIDASRERVWAVLTEAGHVARWFGDAAEIDRRPGGKARFGWAGDGVFEAIVERVEPPSAFSFRWARDPDVQPGEGTATLVEFTLTEVPLGTLLRVVETGFAELQVSDAEQVKAAEENALGWTEELAELKDYAERAVT
ncbi:MAG TPA: SRPBCC domain-containing protein [Streptosporangiaceae bacterium]|nr:SRPBCC domain-containing protein [Streptosporangiaceae bacterium]